VDAYLVLGQYLRFTSCRHAIEGEGVANSIHSAAAKHRETDKRPSQSLDHYPCKRWQGLTAVAESSFGLKQSGRRLG